MKRRSLTAGLAALPLLAACSAAASVTPTAAPAPTAAPTTAPAATVASGTAPAKAAGTGTYYFLAANNSSPFYVPGVKGFNDAGAAVGMKTSFVGPMDLSLSTQISTLEQLIADPNTAGIFLYAIDHKALDPTVKQATEKGIPFVIGAVDSPFKRRNAFVGYDASLLGVQAANWAGTILNGKGKVGTIGLITATNVAERQVSFAKTLKDNYPGITVFERATTDGSAANEATVLDSYIVAHPDMDLVWWADGDTANVVQTFKDHQTAGLKTQLLASDMPAATVQAVKDGVFVGSLGQDTYTEEYWGVMILDQLRQKHRVPDSSFLSAIFVTKDNATEWGAK